MSILERTINNEPTNEKQLRGIEMNEELISQLKDIRNLSFYQYNKYVSAIYEHTNGMCKLISEAYYKYELPDDIKSIWMDDIEHIEPSIAYDRIKSHDIEGMIIVHEYTIFGDYGGHGSVGMSNHRILVNEYNHIDLYGGYGSHMAGISVKYLSDNLADEIDNKTDEILGIYENLDKYPLIDDEDLLNLEYDLSHEVFIDVYRSDLIDAIGSKFDIDMDDYDTDNTLWDLIETLSERSNTYWENEYTSMYIDIDRCIETMTIEDFNQYFYKVE